MLFTRVFGSSGDPEKRLNTLTVTALTAAFGVLLLLAISLYSVFTEVVDNKLGRALWKIWPPGPVRGPP